MTTRKDEKMTKITVFFSIFFFIVSANAQPLNNDHFLELRREICNSKKKSPQEKCSAIRGQWKDGYCLKTRVIKRWKKRRCPTCEPKIIQTERIVEKPIEKIVIKKIKECVSCPVIRVEETQRKAIVKKPKDKKWWWTGPGVFALGLYMSPEKEFQVGVQGKLVFALNDRFRVSGMLGGGVWQDPSLLIGSGLDIRLWKNLFLTTTFNTLWGDYDGLRVARRHLLLGSGVSYWFLNRIEVSFQFIFGTKKKTVACQGTPDVFVGGNFLSANIHF